MDTLGSAEQRLGSDVRVRVHSSSVVFVNESCDKIYLSTALFSMTTRHWQDETDVIKTITGTKSSYNIVDRKRV